MAENDAKGGVSKSVLAYLTLLPAIATAITGWLAFNVQSEINEVTVQLKQLESRRAYDLEIYEAVKESLKGDARDQQVALALVVSVGEEPLKSALLTAFEESSTAEPEIVEQARAYQPKRTDIAGVPLTNLPWRDWDFDIFYCEASAASTRPQAENLANSMITDGAVGRIRVRPLSREKNAEPQYQIVGNVIYRGADEIAIAEKLREFASKQGIDFELKATSQQSPWYISAFLCPPVAG